MPLPSAMKRDFFLLAPRYIWFLTVCSVFMAGSKLVSLECPYWWKNRKRITMKWCCCQVFSFSRNIDLWWSCSKVSVMLYVWYGQDGSILLWKFNTTSNQFEPAASFTGHTGPVITLLFVGNRLYSGSMDNTIRVRTPSISFKIPCLPIKCVTLWECKLWDALFLWC